MNNPNQPINPVTTYKTDGDKIVTENFSGLTKREYAAIEAMKGLLSNRRSILNDFDKETNKLYAKKSVELADSILSELNTRS